MAIVKPDLSQQWASDGDKIAPSGAKIQAGWGPEIPPYQWENFIQNRQDEMLAYLNERGIPEWDNRTNYVGGGKSYVQGSNGVIYRSVVDNGPSTTVQDPVADTVGAYWTELVGSSTETQAGIIRIGTQGEVNDGVLDDVAVTPQTLKTVIDTNLAPAATTTTSGIIRIGTNAEVANGSLNNVAVTPASLKNEVDFTIIYPNGGSEASPANVALNSRYVENSPFPDHHIICQAEIQIGGIWGRTGFSYVGAGVGSGVSASEYDGGIVVQTGNNSLTVQSPVVGNPFGTSSVITTASPCRVKVWKVKGAIV